MRQKDDEADAAAIREAAVTRSDVRTTPVETAGRQGSRAIHRTHEPPSRQCVTPIDAIRGHMAEFGALAPAGPQHVAPLGGAWPTRSRRGGSRGSHAA